MYQIKQVAELAGVSVRTLHHYDEIGLLKPQIAANGYRQYSDEDFAKLQQILFFKELGFPLEEIKQIIMHPSFDRTQALVKHKQMLELKMSRLEKIIRSVDETLQSVQGGVKMSKKKMFEPFDMKKIEEHQKQYEAETKEKYGDSDAYKESARRTKNYTEDDWRRMHEQNEVIYGNLVAAMPKGPASDEAQVAIAAHHQSITDNFYNCTVEIYRGLADMYIADPRFTANIDKSQEGLAAFMSEAMKIYCDRQK